MPSSLEAKLRDICSGDLTGQDAAAVLREASPVVPALEDRALALRQQIKAAEDFLVYGQLGRPGNEFYR